MLYFRICDPVKHSQRDKKKPLEDVHFSKYLTLLHDDNNINNNYLLSTLLSLLHRLSYNKIKVCVTDCSHPGLSRDGNARQHSLKERTGQEGA